MIRKFWARIAIMAVFIVGVSALGSLFAIAQQEKAHKPKSKSDSQKSGLSEETKAEMERLRAKQLGAWYGTQISPTLDAKADELDLQEEISAEFTLGDAEVPHRYKTFRWCFSDPAIRVCGWYGIIRSVSKSPEGSLVEVVVSPRLVGKGANVLFTSDRCVEVWRYSAQGLTCLKWYSPKGTGPFLFGD